jgi:hypothetical protein
MQGCSSAPRLLGYRVRSRRENHHKLVDNAATARPASATASAATDFPERKSAARK